MNVEILSNRLVNISPELKAELDYYLNDVEHEDSYTIVDAFDDYLTLVLDNKPNNEIKLILVDCGYCVQVDVNKVIVSHGKKYWFIYNKQHYDCVSSWEQWIKE